MPPAISELTCLLDADATVIHPLFLEWGRQLKRSAHFHTYRNYPLSDFLFWGLQHGASAESCLPLFEMAVGQLENNTAKPSLFLEQMKREHPNQLQELFKRLWYPDPNSKPSVDPIWSTALMFKYAPTPSALYNASVYQSRSTIGWAKQLSVQRNLSYCSLEALPHQTMLDTMGPESYRLWQLGAWFDLLSRNQAVDGVTGSTYSPYASLRCVIFPGLAINEAPSPQTFMEACFKRYKGKKMAQDLLEGTHRAMDWAEEHDRQDALAYCSALLQHLIPHAVREGLNNSSEADRMDRAVVHCAATGKLAIEDAWEWVRHRQHPAVRRPIAIPTLMQAPVDLLVKIVQTHHAKTPTLGDSIHQWCGLLGHSKRAAQAVVQALTDAQWNTLLKEWDTPTRSTVLCSLLCAEHPRIEALKCTTQARIALAAESLRFLDDAHASDKRLTNHLVLWTRDNNSLTSMALPQPLAFFAQVFPQYMSTWQRLGLDMLTRIPESVQANTAWHGHPLLYPTEAQGIIDGVVSLLMDADVKASALRDMRSMVGGDVPYETLLTNTLRPTEHAFELPATFELSLSHGSPLFE